MKRRTLLGLLACGIAACSMPSMEGSPERAADAQAVYADLTEGRDDALVARMSSANDAATVRAQLPMMRTFAPSGTPPKPKTLGWNTTVNTSGQRYAIAQEYEYPDRFVRSDTTFIKEGEAWKVEGFHVNARMKPTLPVAPSPVEAPAPAAPAA